MGLEGNTRPGCSPDVEDTGPHGDSTRPGPGAPHPRPRRRAGRARAAQHPPRFLPMAGRRHGFRLGCGSFCGSIWQREGQTLSRGCGDRARSAQGSWWGGRLPSGSRPHTSGVSAPGPGLSRLVRTPTGVPGWSTTAGPRLRASAWAVPSGRPVLVASDGPPLALGAVA